MGSLHYSIHEENAGDGTIETASAVVYERNQTKMQLLTKTEFVCSNSSLDFYRVSSSTTKMIQKPAIVQ
jgi:hypothetical protein